MEINQELCDLLKDVPTGNVADNNPNGNVMDSGIKPLDPSIKLIGNALTVQGTGGDNLYIYNALMQAKPGDVLVIDAKGYCEGGHLGDMVVNQCIHKGIRGIIIDGSCRDAEDIRKLNFPVYCRALSPKPTTKCYKGVVGKTVTVGSVKVNQGDFIFADGDGVVVVPKADITQVIENALKKHHKEDDMLLKMEQGEELIDLLHFRELI